MYYLRRKGAAGSVMELSPVLKEVRLLKPDAKEDKENSDIQARAHPP